MPCVIILREGFYDIVISTDKPDKILRLYELGSQLDPVSEDWAPLNMNILETIGSLWITSKTAIFNDEADFRRMFPDRKMPMRLTLRQAEKSKWYHGIVYVGLRYFQCKALREDPHLATMTKPPPPNATDYELLKHYMELAEQRETQ